MKVFAVFFSEPGESDQLITIWATEAGARIHTSKLMDTYLMEFGNNSDDESFYYYSGYDVQGDDK